MCSLSPVTLTSFCLKNLPSYSLLQDIYTHISSAGFSLPMTLWRASSLNFKLFQMSLLQKPGPISPHSPSQSLQSAYHSLKLPWCLLICLWSPFPTRVLGPCLPFLSALYIGYDSWNKISEKLKILANCKESFSITSIDTNPEIVHRDTNVSCKL